MKDPAGSWGVPVSLPGADVLISQKSKPSTCSRCRRNVFHGFARSRPECDDTDDLRHDSSELAGSHCRGD